MLAGYVAFGCKIGTDGAGFTFSTELNNLYNFLYSNHKEKKYVKFANINIDKDCLGHDNGVESYWREYRQHCRLRYSYVGNTDNLEKYFNLEDYINRFCTKNSFDVINKFFQDLPLLN